MQLAIFDIDGTLTDTNAADNACFLQAFEESLGIRDIDTDWTSYRYSTDSGIVSEILEKHRGRADAKDVEVLRTRFVQLLEERFKTRPLQPIPGAPDLLRRLAAEPGWTYAIATGGWRASALLKLRTVRVEIDGVPFASSDQAYSRVAILESVIDEAQRAHSTPFERTVYIGDAAWDVQTAAKMWLPFVGVGAGPRNKRLLDEGALCVLEDFSDYGATLGALETASIPGL